ncbi:MAG: hypothetical protein M2R45_02335 [Verrucomicrobia subdivision 3 bacterium]|nr:hypothetical protein [Limisphaerales bacterium]MCS1414887.1 hypothetical protein [Limisphaerales bacterium]
MSNARRWPLKRAGCRGQKGGRRRERPDDASVSGEGGRESHLSGASRIRHLSTRLRAAAGCTDEAAAYAGFTHEEINHSEYVCGTVHPNGVESFWPMLKRVGRDAHLRALPRLYGTILLPLDDYPSPPEATARNRADNARYPTKTFAAKSSVLIRQGLWSRPAPCLFMGIWPNPSPR